MAAGYVATSVTDAVGSDTPHCTGIETLSHAGRATIAQAFAREGASVIGCNVIVEPAESSFGVVRVVGIPKSPALSTAKLVRLALLGDERTASVGDGPGAGHVIVPRPGVIEVLVRSPSGTSLAT